MTTSPGFESAAERVKNLPALPNEILLRLYALFKQATEGDVSGSRPGFLDIRGRAKFDAWASVKGMTVDQAKAAYTKLVEDLEAGDGHEHHH